jgi:hypothetical protein
MAAVAFFGVAACANMSRRLRECGVTAAKQAKEIASLRQEQVELVERNGRTEERYEKLAKANASQAQRCEEACQRATRAEVKVSTLTKQLSNQQSYCSRLVVKNHKLIEEADELFNKWSERNVRVTELAKESVDRFMRICDLEEELEGANDE